ncbi:dihydropteroate synthase [Laceyella putida]|uniref:Dihydropteroate synthase n=1 Tax=Laceyella putida TaxID=110101 RepID=A0ABW2RQL2_9BACL
MKSNIIQAGPYSLSYDKRTLVMGIVNVTPDSFSDGGKYDSVELALKHAKQLVSDGADIIDVGGESTRPGSTPVSLEEELERVIPIVKALARELDCPISVDTYKAEVAKQAILAGAHIINDIWGAKRDPLMARVAAELDVPIILMHNREEARYDSLIEDVCEDLLASVDLVRRAGVREEKIILDPGIGFAKTVEDNFEVMRHLDQIVALGYPVLLGTSRKSFIGKTLGLPPHERMEGTAATVAYGITKGCQLMRVHDVKEMARVSRMMDALVYGERAGEAG